jgi:tRNA pseudouridine55 synthase
MTTEAWVTSEPEGLLLADKPAGRTSHDVVDLARRALRTKRVGHAGTLDPFATGLLVLLVGRATRLAPYLDAEPKVYEATIRFGSETDSDDGTGAVTREAPLPSDADVRAAIAGFTGTISQLPPSVSAKQVGGVRAHAAARQGAPLELAPVSVTVHAWDDLAFDGTELRATITCGGGTYIRALARDLGRAVHSAAHCHALRRTRTGGFDVADAIPALEFRERALAALRPPASGLDRAIARESLDDAGVRHVTHGRAVPAHAAGARAGLLGPDGALVAIAERQGDAWHPTVVLRDA